MGWRVFGIWVLLLPGALLWQPVLGGWAGLVPAIAGVSAGCLLAWLAAKARLGALPTFLATVAVYFLFGGVVGLRTTTIAGFVPTLDTFKRLAIAVVQGWRDLLTVTIPAGDFIGPAALVWLCALLAGVLGGSAAARSKAIYWPLLMPSIWLVFSILFGVRLTWFAAYGGAVFGLGAIAWIWLCIHGRKQKVNAEVLLSASAGKRGWAMRALAAALSALVALGGSLALVSGFGAEPQRMVLRDRIDPPIDLRSYASPLMKFRSYELDQKVTVLFKVAGMPQGARLRLATMDSYDGHVFSVSSEMGSFNRAGHTLEAGVTARQQLAVTVEKYSGVWVPTVANPATIDFAGERSGEVFDSLYYGQGAGQLIATAGLKSGDQLKLGADVQPVLLGAERDALQASAVGQAPVLEMSGVPEGFTTAAATLTEGSKNAYEQMVALEEAFQAGYFSNGEDGRSRSGHTTERLTTMFAAAALIGDDEQYATAMALLANALGIPARVVLGFYPEEYSDGEWEVTGAQAHVWVEANFAGAGWLTFDPTPNRDRTPETDAPRPKPQPKPQAETPPQPPEQVQDDEVLANQDREKKDSNSALALFLAILKVVAISLGILAILLAPFVIIVALKRRRQKARLNADSPQLRISGGWSEVIDSARDAGFAAVSTSTRAQTAALLQAEYPQAGIPALAQQIDTAIFAAAAPSEAAAQQLWDQAAMVKAGMHADKPWYRRLLIKVSPRSLGGAKAEQQSSSFAGVIKERLKARKGSIIEMNKNRRRRKDSDNKASKASVNLE